jgi:hypothetical protein
MTAAYDAVSKADMEYAIIMKNILSTRAWKLALFRRRVYVAMKAMGAREAAKEFKGWTDLEYLFKSHTVKDFDTSVTPEASATNLAALYKEVNLPLHRVALRLWIRDNPQAMTEVGLTCPPIPQVWLENRG